ncbi:MAG: deoxyribodipyrimidine photolyase [candidate division Zixibacteria bacterium HGW-Zixibacteria-1]|nr:MAG: deoxyribodipyrimidine photolyase [candidate division Zixibacteria bacterium HGW-Zixibacteria-1]
MNSINNTRVRLLKKGGQINGPVLYWMSRDQRVHDNWALLFAQQIALERKTPLAVVFNLVPQFLEAGIRQYRFMLKGLWEVEKELARFNIPFFLLTGGPKEQIPGFIREHRISIVVTDYSPLKISKQWKNDVQSKIGIPFYEVDAHNIVPVWLASDKQEYAAYTIRPKITRLLPEYLTDFPPLKKHRHPWSSGNPDNNWNNIEKSLKVNAIVQEVNWIEPGEKAALTALKLFLDRKRPLYDERRNDPNADVSSHMSPYVHFGMISAQRITLEVQRFDQNLKSQEAYLEQLIIRRELAENFCEYNSRYDSYDGFPDWAKITLDEHRSDPREYLYSPEQLERGETHDELWNAAQLEMVKLGRMHGYMRMYWAKKILEWSATPEKALDVAVYLNDKYQLDGRDPNGYTGIAWSIGGVHDRPWFERDIFGKIRYMSYNGCKRKFDIDNYVEKIAGIING